MALNFIWAGFFITAFVVATAKLVIWQNTEVFSHIIAGIFESSKLAFELSIGLTGVLCLWLGLMKIGEQAGVVRWLSKLVAPFFRRLFPDIPKDDPVFGNIIMNFSANMLGLDNAATPLGLQAMERLQALNPTPERASNAQIMFLVLNTSGLTLIPITVLMFRAELGAATPSDVFLPILVATACSTLCGVVITSIYQKIRLRDPVLLSVLLGSTSAIAGLVFGLSRLTPATLDVVSRVTSAGLIFGLITAFIIAGLRKRLNVYEVFISGAREGFPLAIKIIPYLVAMLVGISVFRACGAMDLLLGGVGHVATALGLDASFLPAMPTALMKPLSGSGARGLMVDAMTTHGPDSFVGRLACILQGSTDTTFYVLAVYFGSVNIRDTRHALPCGLLADAAGILAAIGVAYLFF